MKHRYRGLCQAQERRLLTDKSGDGTELHWLVLLGASVSSWDDRPFDSLQCVLAVCAVPDALPPLSWLCAVAGSTREDVRTGICVGPSEPICSFFFLD